ncbi:MAG: hypothetical protein MZV64_27725 [Ignavibacteriales bacterium]|nr:hypothetical protein [Ignavibacteriales bacterium]
MFERGARSKEQIMSKMQEMSWLNTLMWQKIVPTQQTWTVGLLLMMIILMEMGVVIHYINIDDGSYKFITTNGMDLCNLCKYFCINKSNGKTGHLKQHCGDLYVDINGAKKRSQLYG